MKRERHLLLLIVICITAMLGACSNGSGPEGAGNTDIVLDTAAATEAFLYLNRVRADPPAYSAECRFDLSSVQRRPALTYDTTLQRIAREKALDMARRGYVAHQDPDGNGIDHRIVDAGYPLDRESYFIDRSTANYESLQMAATSDGISSLTGTKAVRDLVWDGGMPDGGHREHLLGIGLRSTLDEAGIGFVRCREGAMYKNYCCVIIARRKR